MARTEVIPEARRLEEAQVLQVREHLEDVLRSPGFSSSKRAGEFLRLIVERALAGEFEMLRERVIGADLFHRPIDYDTSNDPVVRVKASEVRKKLTQYYLGVGTDQPFRIEIPAGTYVPNFVFKPREFQNLAPSTESTRGFSHAIEDPQKAGEKSTAFAPNREQYFGRRSLFVSIGVICLLAIGAFLLFRDWRSSPTARSAVHSIAVLPFENASGDVRQDYFADGVTEELIADLGQVSSLHVISQTSTMSYKGTKKTLPEIAHELSVDAVVEGTVLRDGAQVRITAELIDARTDHLIWSSNYRRDMTDVLTLQDEIAQAIADAVNLNVGSPPSAHQIHTQILSAEAQDNYLQGMIRLSQSNLNEALPYLVKAVESDPGFARAHTALAEYYLRMGEAGWLEYTDAFSKERAEALQAVQLDPSLPEAHAGLANAAMNLNWDWTSASIEFHRALELNPSSAPIHERYALFLERTGSTSEAIAEMQRGLQLDPVSTLSFRNAGFIYYFSRQYDQALAMIQEAPGQKLSMDDNAFLLGDIFAEKGAYAKSIAEFLKLGNSPHALGHLGNAYARAGQVREANRAISELIQHVKKDRVGQYEIALIYAGLGDKDNAFAWLEEAYRVKSVGLTNLKIDPCLDPLRNDPRFANLLRQTGFSSK